MSEEPAPFDLVVIGSGPGGQKAAIQGAKAGRRVLLVERDAQLGGACVHRGTIPSKTMHEMARRIATFKELAPALCGAEVRGDLEVATLLSRLDGVIRSHVACMDGQIQRNGVELWHGRAAFADPHVVEVLGVDRTRRCARGDVILVATGSRPRAPEGIPVDHAHVLDSDSILSLTYLPESLTVLGAGVIAAEYATIFALLGVRVVMVDRGERPLAFVDPELTARLLQVFERNGGRFLGGRAVSEVVWDGAGAVDTRLTCGESIRSEKVLVALGRVPNLEGLRLENAGLAPGPRGLLEVDGDGRTSVPHIYAAGDVVGPPALASVSMEQGRRAVRHALGLDPGARPTTVPVGIYTHPELAAVGLTEAQAREQGECLVGRASFHELARGQISDLGDGLLKLVADAGGRRILGVHIAGESAAELVHIGQMAILGGMEVDDLIRNTFNFPTLAEAYRVAAFDVVRQRTETSVRCPAGN